MKKISVLIVDDSVIMRHTLMDIFSSDPLIEVMGMAGNPFAAARVLQEDIPDVITLDIEMPGMDGLTFLQKIMSQHPIPVVVMTDFAGKNSELVKKAMEYGAMGVIARPLYLNKKSIEELKNSICDKVKTVWAKKMAPIAGRPAAKPAGCNVIVMGASSGGTKAIEVLLEKMTCDMPGIVIVQHMREYFTALFAQRLNELCKISVKEAVHNDEVVKGQALIAPGDKHVLLRRAGGRYFVELTETALVSGHRPSVDVLFQSAAVSAGSDAIGVILTGMGRDGAKGLLKMKQAGAITIAQDEKSCEIFGMPKEAIQLNAAGKILPLHEIVNYIIYINSSAAPSRTIHRGLPPANS